MSETFDLAQRPVVGLDVGVAFAVGCENDASAARVALFCVAPFERRPHWRGVLVGDHRRGRDPDRGLRPPPTRSFPPPPLLSARSTQRVNPARPRSCVRSAWWGWIPCGCWVWPPDPVIFPGLRLPRVVVAARVSGGEKAPGGCLTNERGVLDG